MKRTRILDVGQWWNIVQIHHDERNSKLISFWWREKEHQTLVNDEILLKFIIFREILKWSEILMKRKRILDVGQWWNIVEIHHDERNSKMIWFWWREKEYWTFVNDGILLKFIMMRKILKWSHSEKEKNNIGRWSMMKYCWHSSSLREILKWSDFDEEKKNIRRWSMMKYCWNSSLSEKF